MRTTLRGGARAGMQWQRARPTTAPAPASQRTPLQVSLWAQDIVLLLWSIVGGLAAADFVSQVLVELGFIDPAAFLWEAIIPRLDLNEESSLGTWYASISLLFLAALLGAIAFAKVRSGDRFRWYWTMLAILPLGFSIDEVAQLHDPGGARFHALRDRLGLSGPFLYSWVLFGILSVVVVGLVYRHFVADLPRTTRQLYLLAAALFVAGEVLVEMCSGWYLDAVGEKDLVYQTLTTIEETLSMAGIVVAITGTLHYLQHTYRDIRIVLSGSEARPVRVPADGGEVSPTAVHAPSVRRASN
jgi:hypothetical protein